MLLILIGIAIVIMTIIYEVRKGYERIPSPFNRLGSVLAVTIGIGISIIGLLIPIHGYYKSELVCEYNLEEILPDTDIYVIESKDGYKTFNYIDPNNQKEHICTSSGVELAFSNNEKRPVIRKYIAKPKTSMFTFALVGNIESYKIFVTRDCVKK